MRLIRIYYPETTEIGNQIFIEGDQAHYLRNVLRAKIGQRINFFNNVGKEYSIEIQEISKKGIQAKVINEVAPNPKSKLEITLVQSLSKGERMDYTVQKATELGIHKIIPIFSEFCEVKLPANRVEKKLKHWQSIAINASEQSYRPDIPEICNPISLAEYCNQQRKGILLEPEKSRTISELAKLQWQKFDIVVGPEGGWSPKDLQQLESTGLTPIQFGQRILRTETVAPAILAAIHSLWGDFV